MVDPYKAGLLKTINPYAKKSYITGRLVVVLDGRIENRGLKIIEQISRCVTKDHVHELIVTDEDVAPGGTVNRIAYIGFVALDTSGVIVKGDKVYAGGKFSGTILGFDETHMPNHLNIVIKSESRISGLNLGLEIFDSVVFQTSDIP